MKLSRTVTYAVRAALQLAASDPAIPVPCSRLAAEGGMPERFLLQILRSLVTHGVLRSTRGVEGGYRLARPPEAISLLEVIEAIDGPVSGVPFPSEGLSDDVRQRLEAVLARAAAQVRRELQSVSLADLLAAAGPSARVTP